jgi:hypothetical protein
VRLAPVHIGISFTKNPSRSRRSSAHVFERPFPFRSLSKSSRTS